MLNRDVKRVEKGEIAHHEHFFFFCNIFFKSRLLKMDQNVATCGKVLKMNDRYHLHNIFNFPAYGRKNKDLEVRFGEVIRKRVDNP